MERLSNILAGLSHLNLEGKIVEKQPHASGLGGSCDVYTAWSVEHGKKVAVKQIRTFLKKDPAFAKKLAKEILIWSKLVHENILPLLGYFAEGNDVMPSLVSEWMEKGTLHDFMKTFPRGGIITCSILRDIAAGLSYLHLNKVIHGDLKTQNILISAHGTPLLADFGLSVALSHSQSTMGMTTASTKGTVRWMAIELLSVLGDEPSKPCEQTDMWAFGMVVYELLSWEIPYNNIRNEVLVLMAIMNGQLPLKPGMPESVDDIQLFGGLWDLACLCWKERISRPTAEFVTEHLTNRIMDCEPSFSRVITRIFMI
ncbi:kinase-like protein [Schizopora paradoxa]|uniref:Kinase-like protein n=1 Tax=Schizopora paradoxa TaxID=27342 RepID=A0A0H2RPG3_9AGAM|nr:kinase-like protein [Schizopora paradoxa]